MVEIFISSPSPISSNAPEGRFLRVPEQLFRSQFRSQVPEIESVFRVLQVQEHGERSRIGREG